MSAAGGSSPTRQFQVLYHCVPPASLPMIFEFGLYLPAFTFNTCNRSTQLDWGLLHHLVPIAFRVPKDRILYQRTDDQSIKLGQYIGYPDAALKFPSVLRSALVQLAAQYESRDAMYRSTRKSLWRRDSIRGAHKLLLAEAAGNLRHFGVETFDIERSKSAARMARYQHLLKAYLYALEKNGGRPLCGPVHGPTVGQRLYDQFKYLIRKYRPKSAARLRREHLRWRHR